MVKKIISYAMVVSLSVTSLYAQSYSQKDINELKQKIKQLEENQDELYDRVDENEFEASMNHIKWGGELEVSNNFVKTKQGNVKGMVSGKEYTNNNQWTTKVRLNMESRINDTLKFSGRLSMYKNWADSVANTYPLADPAEGRKPDGSGLYVDRAYVDYTPNKHIVFTIGRQPSSDGPGMTLIDNTKRKATYPSLLFDGAADGVVVSYKIMPNSQLNPILRAAYGKGYQKHADYSPYNAASNDIKDLNVYGGFFEMSLPFNKMGDNLFVLSYVYGTDFVGSAYDGTTNQKNLGDVSLLGVYFENNKAFGTGLNYFISYGHSMPDANNNVYITPQGTMKLLKDDGNAVHVGARYDIANFKIGYEYNYGDKYWFSFTQGSDDLFNKLATRGNVHDMYLIYQIDMNQFLRVGYTSIDYDYTGSGSHIAVNGEPMKTDDYIHRGYLLYNVRF